MSAHRFLDKSVTVVLAVAALAGCPVSSTWTTPRTIPEGTNLHTIGVDSFALVGREGSAPSEGDEVLWYSGSGTHVAPMVFPAYLFRIGLASRMDLGLKASTAGAIQADFKWQLVKTPAFDLALDPSIELSFVDYVSLPVLFGLNAGEGLTITLGPRATWLFVPLGAEDATDQIFAGGLTVGGSLGFRIQLGPRLAVYPEMTWLHALKDQESGELVTLGLGFSFGSGHPDYGPGSIEYVQE
jgi:hypothetical protein